MKKVKTVILMQNNHNFNNKASKTIDQTKNRVSSKKDLEHTMSKDDFKNNLKKWVTFFKSNYDVFATWYLGLDLFLYQKIMLHLMGKSSLAVIIASRGISKSFMIAIYACCKSILEPNCITVIASATRNQAMLILKEKIQNELCTMSPNLAREIKNIKVSQNDGIIEFHNGSRIIIATANQNSRGYRSNCNVYEEARMIDEEVLNSVLSPFLISRQAPYLKKPEFAHLKTEPTEVYISSAWFKSLEWFAKLIETTTNNMTDGSKDQVCVGFDYLLSIHHGLKTKKQMDKEKEKSDDVSFAIEYENQMFDSEGSFFTYDLFQSSRKLKKALLPRNKTELLGNKRVQRLQKKEGVIRILSCDIAMSGAKDSDNSIYTVAEMIPMKGYFMRKICYMEAHNGKTASEQAMRIRRLVNDFDIDICVLDVMTIGLPVLDLLGTELVDEETGEEYRPICAYNDEELKARCRVSTAIPMIFGMRANAQLNSDMIVEMKSLYQQGRVEMLISESEAEEFLSKTNKEYANSDIGDQKNFYELPYINTTLAINECIQLETIYKMGRISIKEKWNNRKDRFSSLLYLLWVSTIIEKENLEDKTESDITDYFLF